MFVFSHVSVIFSHRFFMFPFGVPYTFSWYPHMFYCSLLYFYICSTSSSGFSYFRMVPYILLGFPHNVGVSRALEFVHCPGLCAEKKQPPPKPYPKAAPKATPQRERGGRNGWVGPDARREPGIPRIAATIPEGNRKDSGRQKPRKQARPLKCPWRGRGDINS